MSNPRRGRGRYVDQDLAKPALRNCLAMLRLFAVVLPLGLPLRWPRAFQR